MARKTAGFVLAMVCGALLAGGCAKQEVTKQDEPMAPAVTVAPEKQQPQQQVQSSEVRQPTAAPEVATAPVAPRPAVTQADLAPQGKQVEELKSGLEIIYFPYDSFQLSEQARGALAKNAGLLKKAGAAKIRVEGHCDERGSDEYNLALGETRARQAMNYLIHLGIPAEQISVLSYGKEKPAVPGSGEEAWAKNRRDEFVIVP